MLTTAGLNLSFDQVITIIGLIVNVMQALILPITIYLLVVQTRAMRIQTTALVEQSREMTAQTRVFIDTIYNTTFQGLYDAEAHLAELMMTYPEASRTLMSQVSQEESKQLSQQPALLLQSVDPALREQVRWLGTAMLDFFEHIWTQAKNKGLPADIWQAWEDYMSKMLNETRLRFLWQTERSYYAPGFRRFMDTKIGLPAEEELVSSLPRPPSDQPDASEPHHPHVARVIRAVAENNAF
jgi:hypothetical protein